MKRYAGPIAVSILMTVVLFCFVEGAISVFQLGTRITEVVSSGNTFQSDGDGMSETRHAQHDPDLGWANIPGIRVDDAYGPGTFIEINAQGFRNDAVFSPAVPTGRFRIICSGDSFTLGYGVSNPDTWCSRLGKLGPGIETVNMGQGAYGADQVYLWYKRDGVGFAHDVHIFAIIREDLDRMRHDVFQGYEKPVLRLDDGELVVKNVPVPNDLARRKTHLVKGEIRDSLMLGRAAKGIKDRLQKSGGASGLAARPPSSDAHPYDDVLPVFAALMSDLADINRQKNSRLIFVLLPTLPNWRESHSDSVLRTKLARISSENGAAFVDLTDKLRQFDYLEAASLFLGGTAGGHYSPAGNRFVAETIFEELTERGAFGGR